MAFSARRLTRLRDQHGWNNTELAEHSGLQRASVSKYANGDRTKVSAEACFAMARALGVHPSELDPVYSDPILYKGRNNIGSMKDLPPWLADLCAHIHQVPEGTLIVLKAAATAAVEKCPPQDDEISA